MKTIKIAPSILSADFARLGDQIREAQAGGADLIHIDVMDGHFVPNLTVGPLIVKAVKQCTDLPLDVHLMISNPEEYVEDFIVAGADWLSFHVEATNHSHRLAQRIKAAGKAKVGVGINPATPVASLTHLLDELDYVVVMSVNPGFGGQKFIPSVLQKIAEVSRLISESGGLAVIEVDGGITDENAADVSLAGATMLVAGSFVFADQNIESAIRRLRESANVPVAEGHYRL